MTQIKLNTKHFEHEATLDSGWFVFEHGNGDFVANFETDDNDNASVIGITDSNDSYGNPIDFELTDSVKRERYAVKST